jgi:hypothetical protein
VVGVTKLVTVAAGGTIVPTEEAIGEGTDSEEEAAEELRKEEASEKDAIRRGTPVVDVGAVGAEEDDQDGDMPPQCESCNEMGHTIEDCPHRTERDDEDNDDEDEDDEDEDDEDEDDDEDDGGGDDGSSSGSGGDSGGD